MTKNSDLPEDPFTLPRIDLPGGAFTPIPPANPADEMLFRSGKEIDQKLRESLIGNERSGHILTYAANIIFTLRKKAKKQGLTYVKALRAELPDLVATELRLWKDALDNSEEGHTKQSDLNDMKLVFSTIGEVLDMKSQIDLACQKQAAGARKVR